MGCWEKWCHHCPWGWLFSVEKVSLREDLISVYKYLMCVNKEDADRLFLVVSIGRMRGEGHKYKNSKFHLNIHTQNRKKKKKRKEQQQQELYCKGCWMLEWVAESGCWVSILRNIENPNRHGLEQPIVGDLALSRGIGWSPEVPSTVL